MDEIKETLVKLYNTLNQLEVRGKNNYTILLTCMTEIEKILKEGGANADNPKSES